MLPSPTFHWAIAPTCGVAEMRTPWARAVSSQWKALPQPWALSIAAPSRASRHAAKLTHWRSVKPQVSLALPLAVRQG